MHRMIPALVISAITSCLIAFSATLPKSPINATQMAQIEHQLLNNIATPTHRLTAPTKHGKLESIAGAVVASPGLPHKGFSQDYRFNWVRDAALTIQILITEYQQGNHATQQRLLPYLDRYVHFMQTAYSYRSHYGYRTLGQPKINLNGTLWQQPWARPQNDGPALSAIDLIQISRIKLKQGDQKFVTHQLFNPNNNFEHAGLIKRQLNYICHQWHSNSYGIWEEVSGMHFFVAMVQYTALIEGSKLADKLGDRQASKRYRNIAQHIQHLISTFWQPGLAYIPETRHQQFIKGGGLDTSVMLAALYANRPHVSTPITLNNPKMLATLAMLRSQFSALYPLNWHLKQGVWLGRYLNDIYDGNTFLYGNPWILITAELGEAYYRIGRHILNTPQFSITWYDQRFFNQIAPKVHWQTDHQYSWHKNAKALNILIHSLLKAGDAQLALISSKLKCHDKTCRQLNEQVNRLTGKMTSAPDLTWNYVAIIRTQWARQKLVDALHKHQTKTT